MMTPQATHQATPRQGQTLVLFALMSIVLLAGLGLIIDAGYDYSQRRIMQNAADTAALAGARAVSQASTSVLTTVTSVAVANGVPSASLVTCTYVGANGSLLTGGSATCVNGTAPPAAATGLVVRVSETHATFVMRVLGIATSGTAATSAAQIQVVNRVLVNDFLLAVCGVQTMTSGGSRYNILASHQEINPYDTQPSPPASPIYRWAADSTAPIANGAYGYDWNQRNADGTFVDLGGPTFMIASGNSTNIAQCDLNQPPYSSSSWKGLVSPANSANANTAYLYEPTDGTANVNFIFLNTSSLSSSPGPLHATNGTQGCPAGQLPNDCVILLPIVDTHYTGSFALRGRAWGAFLVTRSGDELTGRLIKHYPVHADGVSYHEGTTTQAWTTGTTGPITITLIEAP